MGRGKVARRNVSVTDKFRALQASGNPDYFFELLYPEIVIPSAARNSLLAGMAETGGESRRKADSLLRSE